MNIRWQATWHNQSRPMKRFLKSKPIFSSTGIPLFKAVTLEGAGLGLKAFYMYLTLSIGSDAVHTANLQSTMWSPKSSINHQRKDLNHIIATAMIYFLGLNSKKLPSTQKRNPR